MAIIKGLAVTSLKKSVGKITMRNTIYGNVASQKIVNMSNPKSAAQARQRTLAKYVNAGYMTLKEICDHSFEGVPYGARSMNEFRRKNYQYIKDWVNSVPNDETFGFLPKSSNGPVPFAGIVSSGSLSNPMSAHASAKGEFDASEGYNYVELNGLSSILKKSLDTVYTTYTIGDFLNDSGLKGGDVLTLVMLQLPDSSPIKISSYKNLKCSYVRGVLKSNFSSEDLKKLFIGERVVIEENLDGDIYGYKMNKEIFDDSLSLSNCGMSWPDMTIEEGSGLFVSVKPIAAAACVMSRLVDNTWCRSTETFKYNEHFWRAAIYPTFADAEASFTSEVVQPLNSDE